MMLKLGVLHLVLVASGNSVRPPGLSQLLLRTHGDSPPKWLLSMKRLLIHGSHETAFKFSLPFLHFIRLQFYLIINLAVGGTNGFFPDDAVNEGGAPKPWASSSSNVSYPTISLTISFQVEFHI